MKALPWPLPLCEVSAFQLHPDLNVGLSLYSKVCSVWFSQTRTRLPELTGRALCPWQPFFITQYHLAAICLAFIARATEVKETAIMWHPLLCLGLEKEVRRNHIPLGKKRWEEASRGQLPWGRRGRNKQLEYCRKIPQDADAPSIRSVRSRVCRRHSVASCIKMQVLPFVTSPGLYLPHTGQRPRGSL